VNLSPVFVAQLLHSLDLDNDRIVTQEIGLVGGFKLAAFILENQLLVGYEGETIVPQFPLQTFLIDGLQKTASHLIVHLEACPDDPITLVLINDLGHGEFLAGETVL
jgi:hypothetical protein